MNLEIIRMNLFNEKTYRYLYIAPLSEPHRNVFTTAVVQREVTYKLSKSNILSQLQ